MSKKYDVEKLFKNFYNMIKTQFKTKICALCSNNGKEYFNECLEKILNDKDVIHQSTYCETPQPNKITK